MGGVAETLGVQEGEKRVSETLRGLTGSSKAARFGGKLAAAYRYSNRDEHE